MLISNGKDQIRLQSAQLLQLDCVRRRQRQPLRICLLTDERCGGKCPRLLRQPQRQCAKSRRHAVVLLCERSRDLGHGVYDCFFGEFTVQPDVVVLVLVGTRLQPLKAATLNLRAQALYVALRERETAPQSLWAQQLGARPVPNGRLRNTKGFRGLPKVVEGVAVNGVENKHGAT